MAIFKYPMLNLRLAGHQSVQFFLARFMKLKYHKFLTSFHHHIKTGWWFRIVFIFHPYLGKGSQFDEHIFQRGWNHQQENMKFQHYRQIKVTNIFFSPLHPMSYCTVVPVRWSTGEIFFLMHSLEVNGKIFKDLLRPQNYRQILGIFRIEQFWNPSSRDMVWMDFLVSLKERAAKRETIWVYFEELWLSSLMFCSVEIETKHRLTGQRYMERLSLRGA